MKHLLYIVLAICGLSCLPASADEGLYYEIGVGAVRLDQEQYTGGSLNLGVDLADDFSIEFRNTVYEDTDREYFRSFWVQRKIYF